MKVPPLDYPTDVVKAELDRLRHPFRIAISRFKNPFNVGAIIRTAHSFLAQEIILIGDAPYYKRASMGMEKYENLVEVESDEAFVALAKERGWNLVCFEKDHATVGLWECAFPEQCVLVMGNEDSGLGETILRAAHSVVGIPMFGVNHSYPVSVASGIAMAEWTRRHYAAGRIVTPSELRDSASTGLPSGNR